MFLLLREKRFFELQKIKGERSLPYPFKNVMGMYYFFFHRHKTIPPIDAAPEASNKSELGSGT